MLKLYIGDVFSIITSVLVVFMIIFIGYTIKKRDSIDKWGRLMIAFMIVGAGACVMAALRDAYATPEALFAMNSLQSIVCSVLGGLITLAAIVSIFLKKQELKRFCFYFASFLFVLEVAVIEVSRYAMWKAIFA